MTGQICITQTRKGIKLIYPRLFEELTVGHLIKNVPLLYVRAVRFSRVAVGSLRGGQEGPIPDNKFTVSRPALWFNQSPNERRVGDLSPELMRPEREGNHTPQLNAVVDNYGDRPPSSIRHRDMAFNN
jgi:hypothetical protein